MVGDRSVEHNTERTPAEAIMLAFAVRRELITIRDHPFYGRYKGLLDKDEAIERFVRWYGERQYP